MLPFEFMLFETPLSQASSNAKRGGPWQTKVHGAAAADWGGLPPTAGQLAVSITHLYDRFDPAGQQPDIDNIAKPIVDALEGLVYDDDAIVTDVLCRRRSLDGDLEIQQPSALLLTSLGANREFVHIIIDDAPIREVHL